MSTPPVPASRKAYDHVKRRLLDGSLADGELLSEGAVAEAVGISRTPVREAFLQLESEGLLQLYPKRGALVVPIAARDVRDLFDARIVVEGSSLRVVVAARLEGLLDELDAVLDEQRDLLAARDLVAYAGADRRLHRTWVAAAGNGLLLGFFDQLRDRQQRVTALTLRRSRDRPAELMAEHEALVEAIRAEDLDRALALLGTHLEAARTALDGPDGR